MVQAAEVAAVQAWREHRRSLAAAAAFRRLACQPEAEEKPEADGGDGSSTTGGGQ